MKPRFASGDKVFAKVRGYPPWPARVEGLADETPNKMRYHVYFYGTGETAVVKAEDICTYVHNKVRLGKTKKTKNFLEAVNQIEAQLSSEEKNILLEIEKNPSSEVLEKSQSEEPTTAKRSSGAGKQKTPNSTKKPVPKDKKRKVDSDSTNEDVESRKSKTSTASEPATPVTGKTSTETKKVRLQQNASASDEADPKNPEVLSRSGRKIKPKRFADFENDVNEETSGQPKPQIVKTNNKTAKADKDDASVRDDEYLVAFIEDEKVKIPLKLNRPPFEKQGDYIHWVTKVRSYGYYLKHLLEMGKADSDTVYRLMDKYTKSVTHSLNTDLLKAEARLLELDLLIRSALHIDHPDIPSALPLLDEMNNLTITTVMLKKNPDVVTTVSLIRKYVGSNLEDEEKMKEINENSEIVRQKAETLFNKFKALFFIPAGQTFSELYTAEREMFIIMTKDLTEREFISLVEDPMDFIM